MDAVGHLLVMPLEGDAQDFLARVHVRHAHLELRSKPGNRPLLKYSVNSLHLFQLPRADEMSDSECHSQHPASHPNNHRIILPSTHIRMMNDHLASICLALWWLGTEEEVQWHTARNFL